jgi:antirestriction protein ArdC
MPVTNFFKDESKYYSILLHELVHWSGHKERLDRESLNSPNSDREMYSYEELIAELGSVILNTEFNLFSE